MNADGNGPGRFEREGFAVFDDFLPAEQCEQLIRELSELYDLNRAGTPTRIGGVRNLLQTSLQVLKFASDPALIDLLHAKLDSEVFPVRSIFFDKTPDANWSVAWHQDLHIAVAERIETPGFGPWSVKSGVVHVQPPAEILSRMVTVRLHLDDCDESNGALRIIPGSHATGILSDVELEAWRQHEAITCCVPKGGLLLMRPLLLHASSSATKPGHRRVLHLEYASGQLPNGLRWHEWQ
jgi:hypothetical protein